MPAKSKAATTKYSLGRTQNHELTVPSGSMCLVRRPGVQGLIKAGVLDSLDSLAGVLKTEHFDRVEGKPSADQVKALMQDKSAILDALEMVDKVVEYVVVQPRLLRAYRRNEAGTEYLKDEAGREIPLKEDERDPETLYTDEVDLTDRMFILQYVMGGSSDLEAFRGGLGQTVGNLAAMQDLPL